MFGDLNVILFDLETTGLDLVKDRIVEYAFVSPDGSWRLKGLVDPEIPIPKEATEIHGITDEDVKDSPRFEEVAGGIVENLQGAILAGFNSRQFDTPFLGMALHRAGFTDEARALLRQPEIDLYRVWTALEPRSLEGAIRRFSSFGADMYGTLHRAEADVEVLPDVFQGMVEELGVSDPDEWIAISCPPEEIDREGKFVRREDGAVVFNFGKNQGTPVNQANMRDYLEWMLGRDFGPEVKRLCRKILAGEAI